MELLVLAGIVASVFMGVSIGASTVASSFGPVNSAGSTNVFRSALIAGLFATLGAVLQGGSVTETVGSGLLNGEMITLQVFSVLFIGASLVIISVLFDYPMPTAFTIVGAVVGSGIGFGTGVNWGEFGRILGYWLLVPFIGVGMGYLLARILRKYVPKDEKKIIRYLLLASGCYVAYTSGANSVGLAVGPLSAFSLSMTTMLLIGGLSILAGSWIYSPRIIRAVSFDYSNIGPRRSIAALSSAAFMAQIGIIYGIPISFNEAVIASIIGSGMVSEDGEMGSQKIARTGLAWAGAFLLSATLTGAVGLLF
jgi:phosphate/sulfate permease